MMTASDLLRVGQLLLNKGLWARTPREDDAGINNSDPPPPPIRLLSEKYVHEMLHPSFPQSSAAYGFLTWLNTAVAGERTVALLN
eukprot:COSAG01_NODE_9628_length_2385_cov_1.463255_3_plen_85_part_00